MTNTHEWKVGDTARLIEPFREYNYGYEFLVTEIVASLFYDSIPILYPLGIYAYRCEFVPSRPQFVPFSEVRKGDRVRLTGHDEVHEFVVDVVFRTHIESHTQFQFHESEGWKVEILSRAAHEPVLPTEPGLYVDSKGDPWKLADNGYWYDSGYTNNSSNRDIEYITSRAPFTRLVPESEVSK